MMANDYGIPRNSINVRNLQANAIVENIHQTIGNIICSFKTQEIDLDNENPWEGIVSSTMFIVYSAHYLLCSIHHHNWYLVGM